MDFNASIKTSASALVTDFVATASFSAAQVSACDYGVLDNTGGCAIVIQPLTSTVEWLTFDSPMLRWGLRVEAYIKDTLNVPEVLTRIWDIHDAVTEVVITGSTINTLHRVARPTSISRPPDAFVSFGGKDYLPVYFTVQVEEEG